MARTRTSVQKRIKEARTLERKQAKAARKAAREAARQQRSEAEEGMDPDLVGIIDLPPELAPTPPDADDSEASEDPPDGDEGE